MRTVAWFLVALTSLAMGLVLSVTFGTPSWSRSDAAEGSIEPPPDAEPTREERSSARPGLAPDAPSQDGRSRDENAPDHERTPASPTRKPDGKADESGDGAPGKPSLLHDESDTLFAEPRVLRLSIEVDESNLDTLLRDPRSYVRATVREEVREDAREEVRVYEDVGLHLKGAAGSYRDFSSKPALTLNFDRFRDKQHFHGIDKLHLNNSVQDGSYLNELICSDLFRAMDIPSPRVSHARVTLNGRDRGFYVLKEGFDRRWLSRWFADKTGNLYDGGFLQEIDAGLEKTAGENPDDRADLERLDQAARNRDITSRKTALSEVLDVDRFVSFLCLETITWHWDGYAMKRNNYRLYHDPVSRKFVFLPHGMDQMFQDTHAPPLPYFSGRVARAVIEVPEWRALYVERLAEILDGPAQIEKIRARVAGVESALEPALKEIGEESWRRWQYRAEGQLDSVEARLSHLAGRLTMPIVEEPVRRGGRRRGGWRR